jgi:hypothetical protein
VSIRASPIEAYEIQNEDPSDAPSSWLIQLSKTSSPGSQIEILRSAAANIASVDMSYEDDSQRALLGA